MPTDTKTKPRVTFVRCPILFSARSINNEATPAIAFAYLSAYIQKFGYEVSWVDGIGQGLNNVWPSEKYSGFLCHGLPFDEIVSRIPADTGVIAFSGMFSGEWPLLRDLIMKVRERFPKALFVAGGEHVTAMPEYSLRDCPALDACVRGEGEHTLYELLEAWRETGTLENVDGVSYLKDGVYHENGGLPRIKDAATIPWPYWPEGYLEKFWESGRGYGVSSERDMPFMASRGCPYRCSFCSSPQMWTTRYVLREPDDCIAEIKAHIKRYNITSLQFYDLTAVTKKGWIMEFCRKLIDAKLGITWSLPSGTRSEVLDHETLALMKEAGCSYLVYAPESGSPETLVNIRKQIKIERLTESVMEAKRQGFVLRTNLIMGFPTESRKNVWQTAMYGLKLAMKGVDEVPYYMYSPYPGSEFFHKLNAEGRIKVNDKYFLQLTSINGDYFARLPEAYSLTMGSRELAFYRSTFMMLNYAISYLFYPSRILRTISSLSSPKSATVLEHRIKDALKRSSGHAAAAKS